MTWVLFLSLLCFRLPPTLPFISYQSEWETDVITPEIQQILNQPFYYLAKGNQTYVFESQDGQYVLKLFRFNRTRFPPVPQIKRWFARLRGKKVKDNFYTKMNKTFLAAKTAAMEAREFTQVVYCHLNQTENKLPVMELVKEGSYFISLDKYRFVLQRKVTPFAMALLQAKDNPEKMHALLDSFVELLARRANAGIRNADPNLLPNFGFFNNKAVELDFGNYRKLPHYDDVLKAKEFSQYILRLQNWLSQNAPEYTNYLNNKKII